jgi:hypothetical protein
MCIDDLKGYDVVQIHGGTAYSHNNPFDNVNYYRVSDFYKGENRFPIDITAPCATVGGGNPNDLIYDPNRGCTSSASTNFRLENTCTVAAGGNANAWSSANTCNGTYYFDTQLSNGLWSTNDMERIVNLAFQIPDWDQTQVLQNKDMYVVALMYNYGGETMPLYFYNSSPKVISYRFIRGSSDAEFWDPTNGFAGAVRGIVAMNVPFVTNVQSNIPNSNETTPTEIKFNVVLFKYTYGAYPGQKDYYKFMTYCPLTVTNQASYAGITSNTRVMNLLCFKNSGELAGGSFKSDLRSYSYGSKGNFQNHVKNTYGNQIHCRVNFQFDVTDPTYQALGDDEVLPNAVLDKDGYAVLFKEDFASAGVDPAGNIDFSKMNSKSFTNTVLQIWYRRLLNAVRLGIDEDYWNPPPEFLHANGTLTNQNFTAVSALYKKIIGTVVIQGFKLKVSAQDYVTNDEQDAALQDFLVNYTPNLQGYTLLGQHPLTNNDTTGGAWIPTNYTPVCVIFANRIAKTFSQDTSHYNGLVVATGLHEIAHGWYTFGSTNQELESRDDSSAATAAHNYYCFDSDEFAAGHCLMMYPQNKDGTPNTDITYYRTWKKDVIDRMQFSEGVAERMSNVFMPTFKKTP